MNEKILYWSTFVASALCVVLLILSVLLVSGNRDVQMKIAERQNVINVAKSVLPLNQQLSQALYDVSVKKKDKAIENLLVSQGFTLPEKKTSKKKSK